MVSPVNNGLPRAAKVRGRTRTGKLFTDAQTGYCFPFRYFYRTVNSPAGVSILVSVPKKIHKRAVTRNLLKRRTREAFRLTRQPFNDKLRAEGTGVDIALIFTAKENTGYEQIRTSVEKILTRICGSV